MPIYPYDELTPIIPGKPSQAPSGSGRSGAKVPKDVEIWPTKGQGKPKPGEPGAGNPKPGEPGPGKPKPGEPGPGKPKPGEQTAGKPTSKRTTLTDTEKVIGESDGTARGVIKRVYDEAKRKTHRMAGKAGQEAGSSLSVFEPLLEAKINWPRLLKQKVKFYADKVGRKMKQQPSYLMYPWKAQAQVGILAKAPLRKPEKNYIYLIFAFDTSGSIGQDEMQNIVNELNSVANTFKNGTQGITGKVFEMEWDTAVHQFTEFKPSQKIKVLGGGGTDPTSIFKYIDKKIKRESDGKYVLDLGPQDQQSVRKLPGTKYTTAPFLVIFTDGDFFRNLNKASLGKIYGISEDNIFYILTDTDKYIYPQKEGNHIWYDTPKF